MNFLTLITMGLILSIVWGGFIVSLIVAIKKEEGKSSSV